MAFDELLVHLGEFGRYQKRIYFLLCLPAISCALHKLAWVFLAAKAKHRYRDPFTIIYAFITFSHLYRP
jgi:MFS transporter, OCT family, solute carrier family 22 (organic cation transporter), member 4/5